MKGNFTRSIPLLLLSLFFICHSSNIGASPNPLAKTTYKGAISRIVSIKTHQSKGQAFVTIVGDGRISKYNTESLKTPPRIVVDIQCKARLLEATTIGVDNPDIKSIRVGYHPDKIRLVIDVKGEDIPAYKDKFVNNTLIITLKPKNVADEKNHYRHLNKKENIKKPVKIKKSEKKKSNDIRKEVGRLQEEKHTVPVPISSNKIISDSITSKNISHVSGINTGPVISKQASVKKENPIEPSPGDELIQMVDDDGKKDTSFYLRCLESYRSKDWKDAILNFTNFIKRYPDGRYTEKAYFILAKSYDQSKSKSRISSYKEVKDRYDDAASRYPTSEFVPDAMFSIGNLFFQIKNYSEALGYYNLVLKEDKNNLLQIKTLAQKIKILILKNRKSEALDELNKFELISSKYPDLPERTEARTENAKILYEMNKFYESIQILEELLKSDPKNLYLYPEISLYLGYNYYQLGDNKKARENLYRFYNMCPDRKINHLVLNQIGDTYRNEGMIQDDAKFYRMVLDRFPNTDGAIISKIRLAEQQENIDWIAKTRKEVGSPQNIYEDIVNHSLKKKEEKNPLIQLSMLKLGITYRKDKEYQKILKILKELLDRYPNTSLKRELTHALMVTIESIQKTDNKDKNYINIINFYLKEKKLFLMINAPELFLPVARAFVYADLKDMAIEVFKKADLLLPDSEKPDDLLFLLGKYFYERENNEEASKRFEILTKNYPNSKYLSEAYPLEGNILLNQKKYAQAADIFDIALKQPVTTCKKANLLIKKARALMGGNFRKRALNSINEASEIKKGCDDKNTNIDQEIGNIYLSLGDAKKAFDIFNQAINSAKEEAVKVPLRLKLAECYWLLNKREDSLKVYHQIASLNDPFWSNLAKEKIDEIQFNRDNNPKQVN
jgi:TolA-binding protein